MWTLVHSVIYGQYFVGNAEIMSPPPQKNGSLWNKDLMGTEIKEWGGGGGEVPTLVHVPTPALEKKELPEGLTAICHAWSQAEPSTFV